MENFVYINVIDSNVIAGSTKENIIKFYDSSTLSPLFEIKDNYTIGNIIKIKENGIAYTSYNNIKIADITNNNPNLIRIFSFKSIIKTSDYKLIESLEVFVDRLKEYYIDLFYEDRVQTFIFYLAESRMYDPCMIEFLIRNNILKRKRNFLHVTHQLEMNKTFSLEYDCSLFRSLEVKDMM